MKKITPIDIMIALIMISFLFTIFTGCTPKEEGKKWRDPQTIKYGDVITVKKGFYAGCNATIEARVSYYSFRATLKCPQNPDVIIIGEGLHTEDL